MKKMLLFILVGILSLSSLTFSKEEKVEITVSAAASLKEVMEELSEKFQNILLILFFYKTFIIQIL